MDNFEYRLGGLVVTLQEDWPGQAEKDKAEARRLGYASREEYLDAPLREVSRRRTGLSRRQPAPPTVYPDIPHTPPEHLNSTQFSGTVHGISPNQLAIPGMEEHAHPFAKHLARGFMLQYDKHPTGHTLSAWDVSDPKWPSEAASLDWAGSGAHHPGEVEMVTNYQAGGRETHGAGTAKGLAGALFHSAHYWNFGQSTLPIHSPVRTDAGEHFATKTRPDLKPDVWYPVRGRGEEHPEVGVAGKPPGAAPRWPNVGEDYHPFQKAEIERRTAHLANLKRQSANRNQGTLF
jgi:hypothetical protein